MDTSGRDVLREYVEVFELPSGPTEIRTRVSAVRGQRPWPLDDGALPLQKLRGRDSNPDSTVQSRMSCLLDDPGVVVMVGWPPLINLRRLGRIVSETSTSSAHRAAARKGTSDHPMAGRL